MYPCVCLHWKWLHCNVNLPLSHSVSLLIASWLYPHHKVWSASWMELLIVIGYEEQHKGIQRDWHLQYLCWSLLSTKSNHHIANNTAPYLHWAMPISQYFGVLTSGLSIAIAVKLLTLYWLYISLGCPSHNCLSVSTRMSDSSENSVVWQSRTLDRALITLSFPPSLLWSTVLLLSWLLPSFMRLGLWLLSGLRDFLLYKEGKNWTEIDTVYPNKGFSMKNASPASRGGLYLVVPRQLPSYVWVYYSISRSAREAEDKVSWTPRQSGLDSLW